MILEVAMLNVIKGKEKEFEQSFKEASCIISRMNGYIPHDFQRCLEEDGEYILLVK
jgi:heme-degrading monooxygenase HmoA